MIDVFALVHVPPHEKVERVYHSHVSRLIVRLFFATACLVLPFFFLFDYRGTVWLAAAVCWLFGIGLLWLAFDVWSSAVVFVTSERMIGAERTSWGRVRVCDWRLSAGERLPVWRPSRWWPMVGTLTWKRADGYAFELPWAKRPEPKAVKKPAVKAAPVPAMEDEPPSRPAKSEPEPIPASPSELVSKPEPETLPTPEERRERLIERLKEADLETLERLEKDIDDPAGA